MPVAVKMRKRPRGMVASKADASFRKYCCAAVRSASGTRKTVSPEPKAVLLTVTVTAPSRIFGSLFASAVFEEEGSWTGGGSNERSKAADEQLLFDDACATRWSKSRHRTERADLMEASGCRAARVQQDRTSVIERISSIRTSACTCNMQ